MKLKKVVSAGLAVAILTSQIGGVSAMAQAPNAVALPEQSVTDTVIPKVTHEPPPVVESIPPPVEVTPPVAEETPSPAESTPPSSNSEIETVPEDTDTIVDTDKTEEETDEEKAESKALEAEKLDAEEKAAIAKAEEEKKKSEKVLVQSAALDGDIASVGGGIIEYHGGGGDPRIEVYTKSSSRVYGNVYVPNGVIFRCYRITEGQISMADFEAATYSIDSTNGTPQNIKTPVGKYNIFCTTSLKAIEVGGKSITVYSGLGYAGGEVNVNNRPITIAADSKQKSYGEADPGLTYTVSSGSIVPGDTLLGSLFREKAGPATEGVGVYDIKSTLSNTNYVITYAPAKLEIVRANLSITASTPLGRYATVEYGAIAPQVSFTITGLENNDTVNNAGGANNLGTVTVACAVANDSVPGNYPIIVSGLGTSLDNYNISYTNGNVQVNRRTVMAVANGYTKTYGVADTALTTTLTAPNAATPSTPDISDSGAAMYPIKYTLSRTAGEGVGSYPISIEVDAGTKQYYNVQFTSADVVIEAAVLTVKANTATREYGDANPVFSVTYSGFVNSENENILGGKLSLITSAVRETPVGKHSITPSGLTSGNYAIQFLIGDLFIEKRNVEAHMVATGKMYGEADGTMTYTLPEAVIDPVNSPLIGTPMRLPGENVGAYKIMANFPNGNYKVKIVTADFTITPAPLTATVNDTTRKYGEDNPTFTVRYDGFKRGDTPVVVMGAPTFTTLANIKSPIGNYPVAITGGLSARNYNISFAQGNLSVTKRLLTVLLDNKTQVYGAEEKTLTYTLSEELIDPTGSPLTISMQRERGTNVGSYAITGTATNPNYTITVKDAVYTITAADLVVQVNNAVRKYGEDNPVFTVSYNGLQLGDAADALTGELVFATAANRLSSVGDYPITVSGVASGNYTISFVPGTLAVEQRPLIVSLEDKTQVYGAAEKALTYALSEPLVDPTGSPLTLSMQRKIGTDVGSYAITGSFVNSNYDITVNDAVYAITAADLTVRVNNSTRKYGEDNPAFIASYEGLQLGDAADALTGKLVFNTAAEQKSFVGDYFVAASGLSSKNYTITFADGNLSVTQRPLHVSLEDKTQVYGAEEKPLTYILSEPLVDPVSSPLTISMQREHGTDVGSYAITGSFVNPNYDITVDAAVYAITAADLTVRVNDAFRVYGGENPTFTATYEGLQLGDDADALTGKLVLTTIAERSTFVGAYPIKASGLTSDNYTISFVHGTLTIDQRPLVIATEDRTQVYGADEMPLTYTLSEELIDPTDSPLVGELVRENGRDADSYAITGEFVNGNYDIHFVPGVYEITPAPLTIKVDEATRKYGDENPDFTVVASGFQYEDVLTDLNGKLMFTTEAQRLSEVGDYAVTVTGATSKNYIITLAEGILAIEPRPITVTANSKTQEYGDMEQGLTYRLSEKEVDPTDNPLIVTITKPEGKDVGSYIITVQVEDNKNYIVTPIPSIYTILPAPLVITVVDKERPHGAENPEFEATYDGFKNGENNSVLEGELIFKTDASIGSSGGKYTVHAQGVSGKNYAITFTDGTLTVQNPPVQPTPIPPETNNPATGNGFLQTYPLAAPIVGLLAASTAASAWLFGKKRKKKEDATDESEANEM